MPWETYITSTNICRTFNIDHVSTIIYFLEQSKTFLVQNLRKISENDAFLNLIEFRGNAPHK